MNEPNSLEPGATMPPREKYAALLTVLRVAQQQINTAKDDDDGNKARLVACIVAVREVILYVNADPLAKAARLTDSLALVENALRDAERGAKPRLLDHKPQGGDKPSGTWDQTLRGLLAYDLEILASRAFGRWEADFAARFVVGEARKAGLFAVGGSELTWERLIQWAKDARRGKAAPETCRAYQQGLTEFRKALKLGARPTLDQIKAQLREMIPCQVGLAPDGSPRPSRNRRSESGGAPVRLHSRQQ